MVCERPHRSEVRILSTHTVTDFRIGTLVPRRDQASHEVHSLGNQAVANSLIRQTTHDGNAVWQGGTDDVVKMGFVSQFGQTTPHADERILLGIHLLAECRGPAARRAPSPVFGTPAAQLSGSTFTSTRTWPTTIGAAVAAQSDGG